MRLRRGRQLRRRLGGDGVAPRPICQVSDVDFECGLSGMRPNNVHRYQIHKAHPATRCNQRLCVLTGPAADVWDMGCGWREQFL